MVGLTLVDGVTIVIGMVIGLARDEILRHIDIVLSCKQNLEFLQARVKSLQTIITRLEQYMRESNNGQRISIESAVQKWAVKLQDVHRDASAMEQNILRINVISRYRTGHKINQKISDLDKHLKLVPLIQLQLTLWMLMIRKTTVFESAVDWSMIVRGSLSKLGRVLVINQILGHIKMVFCFNKNVASLIDLVTSIRPIFYEIREIQYRRRDGVSMHEAINEWIENMSHLLDKANEYKIEFVPWWNVICRYNKSKEITSLISDIGAHVQLASVINLELLKVLGSAINSNLPF